ncbi:MAG: ribosome assembly RNA-binding protein YhbY [Kangiellaceae bacterium]|nr:ribosome assembly RNA-binding protein YhbY [Kangiellaceae bacterium]|tara:strand:+ start:4967 stop:5260 length:294 start_codon:yes stop_codon:yes gene_type:complete
MALTPKQRQYLKSLAHSLKPVVLVGGNGVTEAVVREAIASIDHHELIKIKFNLQDKEERLACIDRLLSELEAEKVQLIGHTLVMYRPARKPRIQLPK